MSPQPEFSRLIAIEGIIPDTVRKEKITATAEECAALAKRFDLRELSGLTAEIGILRVSGGALRLEGDFKAEVVQTCVVSLQDVHGAIDGHFETFFTEESPEEDEEDDDAPEMVQNGMIDLGEAVAQYLALELDPYPRAPGVSLAAQLAEIGMEVKNNPFQALADIKRKTEKE